MHERHVFTIKPLAALHHSKAAELHLPASVHISLLVLEVDSLETFWIAFHQHCVKQWKISVENAKEIQRYT